MSNVEWTLLGGFFSLGYLLYYISRQLSQLAAIAKILNAHTVYLERLDAAVQVARIEIRK